VFVQVEMWGLEVHHGLQGYLVQTVSDEVLVPRVHRLLYRVADSVPLDREERN